MGVYQDSQFDFLSKYAGAAAARDARAQRARDDYEKGAMGLAESAGSLIAYKKRKDALGAEDAENEDIDKQIFNLKKELATINAQLNAADKAPDYSKKYEPQGITIADDAAFYMG